MQNLKNLGRGALAASGAAALVLGLVTPAIAAGTFDTSTPVIDGPSSVVLPKSGIKDLTFTFQFEGPGAPEYTYTASPKSSVVARNPRMRAAYVVNGLEIHPGGEVEPGPPPYGVPASVYTAVFVSASARLTTPGRYRISIPVTSSPDNVTRVGTKDIVVRANTTISRAVSSPSWPSVRMGRTLPITLRVPYYQAGARVTAYFKAKGTRKWKKVGVGRVKNSNADTAKVRIKIRGKHTKRSGSFKFRVGSAPYAPGYTTKAAKLRVAARR